MCDRLLEGVSYLSYTTAMCSDSSSPSTPSSSVDFLSKSERWKMFDQISSTYDRLNRLITFGQDQRWRRRVVMEFPTRSNLTVLDLATGTGDLMLSILNTPVDQRVTSVIGMDMSNEMMSVGRQKLSRLAPSVQSRFSFQHGDATKIPFDSSQFDVVTMGFGIRNVESVEQCLSDIFRVLKPTGRLIILEGSIPQNRLIRFFYYQVFRSFVPAVGRFISGHRDAYRYLNQSVETFPSGQAFLSLLDKAGFKSTRQIPLFFGSVSLYIGDKGEVNR